MIALQEYYKFITVNIILNKLQNMERGFTHEQF